MKKLSNVFIIICLWNSISLCGMADRVSRIVVVIKKIADLEKVPKTVKLAPVRQSVIPKIPKQNVSQREQARNLLIQVKRDLELNNDLEGLRLYAMYEQGLLIDASDLYFAESRYLEHLFIDQALTLYATIPTNYPELFTFIQKYQCHMSPQDLQENYRWKKGLDIAVAISRIINAWRAKKVIQINKLTHIDVPQKCLVVKDGEFLCYAQKITNIAEKHVPTIEEKRQFDQFVTLTGYSDFAEAGNYLYDTKAKKYFFVDLEDDSFMGPHSLSNNAGYDDRDLNLQNVKDQAEAYAKAMSKLRHSFYRALEKEFAAIKNAIDLLQNANI